MGGRRVSRRSARHARTGVTKTSKRLINDYITPNCYDDGKRWISLPIAVPAV